MGSGDFQASLSLDGAAAALILSQKRLLTLEPASFPEVIGHYQALGSRSRLGSYPTPRDFPGGASGKESACPCRRLKRHGLIPGSGRSPGGGHGNPLQYSWQEKSQVAESDTPEATYAHTQSRAITLHCLLPWGVPGPQCPAPEEKLCLLSSLDLCQEAKKLLWPWGLRSGSSQDRKLNHPFQDSSVSSNKTLILLSVLPDFMSLAPAQGQVWAHMYSH